MPKLCLTRPCQTGVQEWSDDFAAIFNPLRRGPTRGRAATGVTTEFPRIVMFRATRHRSCICRELFADLVLATVYATRG